MGFRSSEFPMIPSDGRHLVCQGYITLHLPTAHTTKSQSTLRTSYHASIFNKMSGKATVGYKDRLDAVCRARYLQKLKDIGDKDPYEMRNDEWSTDVNLYPAITYPDIVNYLVNSCSAYSLEELKGYKSLEAYNYFVSGWVQEIKQATLEDRCVLIARVRHSQRSTDPCLIPWVISEKDGRVVSGHCTCMAGLGEICSHVAALLFAIEATVKLRDSTTVTQEKSYWLLPSAVKKEG